MRSIWLAWAIAALVGLGVAEAHAETRTYVIAIGNNSPPADGEREEPLPALRYADDDAAAFFTFTRDLSRRATLLTVLDSDSQKRFPGLADSTRSPTLAELKRVVAQYRQAFEEDQRGGHEPVLLFFYSGHGRITPGAAASLTLLDGALTQDVLYQEVLAALPARYVHLFVDACHAEAVVRPRDVSAETVELSPADAATYAGRSTLARFPHVGAIIATTTNAQSHEWDVYEGGVFSHELLSGLRGAADVNGDGRIEYSELAAFLAAANRGVADPRARLAVVAHPPALNRRVAIVDLAARKMRAQLVGDASTLGWFHVEDEHGNRLADVRAEHGFRMSLDVPPEQRLYIVTKTGEATVRAHAGGRIALEDLALHRTSIEKRGALDSAMQHGLFSAPFGPIYYRAFVDQTRELEPVALVENDDGTVGGNARPSRRPAYAAYGAATAFGVLSLTFTGLSAQTYQDWQRSDLQRLATAEQHRFYIYEGLAIGSTVAGGIAAIVGLGLTLKARRSAR